MSESKTRKIEQAVNFSGYLKKKSVKFIGISGSVSYEPREEDDVDVFIISEKSKLWTVILKSLIARRMVRDKEICLSLFMDADYAADFYSGSMSPLKKTDAKRVIPLHGSEYYEELLFKMKTHSNVGNNGRFKIHSIVDFVIFLFLAPFLYIKTQINSHIDVMKKGESAKFSPKISRRYFYLDSEKYRRYEMDFKGDDNDK
jgi:hypothetical protein